MWKKQWFYGIILKLIYSILTKNLYFSTKILHYAYDINVILSLKGCGLNDEEFNQKGTSGGNFFDYAT